MGRADRGASIAPTALWCPYGSRPTAGAPPPPLPRRSCQDSSLANSPRGERLRSEGTENALKAHLERAAVDAGGRVSRPESNRDSRAPKPPGLAARSPPAAPRSAHSVLSEIFGNVVFGCRGEAKRGEEGAPARQRSRSDGHGYDRLHVISLLNRPRPSWRSKTDPPSPAARLLYFCACCPKPDPIPPRPSVLCLLLPISSLSSSSFRLHDRRLPPPRPCPCLSS